MGVSGDMILGALIDAGREPASPAPARAGARAEPLGERLAQALTGLNLPGYALRWERVMKGPFAATQVTVEIDDTTTERHLSDVEALLEAADIPDDVRQDAQAVFRCLAEVEAAIHGTTPDQVHFHELGAIDTLVDVVGALWGLKLLGVEKVFASPLPAARGWVQSMHGPLPLPAPATLALLRGVLLSPAPVEGELVTPTGAALLTHLAEAFGPPPAMTLRAIGYGAGRKDFPSPGQGASSHPNVLRLWLGEVQDETPLERVVLLETNIDDMNPQLYEHVAERLFDAGALDVTLTPVQMKKNRPGTILSVLCRPAQADELSEIVFRETTTLGIRRLALNRQALPRRFEQLETPFGAVRVKVATLPDGTERAIPEYEDCRRLAREAGASLRAVVEAARGAAGAVYGGS
jgi:uncharacterized protein (TIGR00299 family) protein